MSQIVATAFTPQLTPEVMAKLTKTDHWNFILHKQPSERTDADLDHLCLWVCLKSQNVKMVQGLTVTMFREFCRHVTLRETRKGEVLFFEGDEGDEFFVIAQGLVGIYVDVVTQAQDTDTPREDGSSPPNTARSTTSTSSSSSAVASGSSGYAQSKLSISSAGSAGGLAQPLSARSGGGGGGGSVACTPRTGEGGGGTAGVGATPREGAGGRPVSASSKYGNRVNVLRDGYGFGELALEGQGGRRAATIRCLQPCTLLVLNREQYEKINEHSGRESMLADKRDFVDRYFPLSSLNDNTRASVTYMLQRRVAAKNDVLLRQGQHGGERRVYFIIEGTFQVFVTVQAGDGERVYRGKKPGRSGGGGSREGGEEFELPLSILHPGSWFGDEELLERVQEQQESKILNSARLKAGISFNKSSTLSSSSSSSSSSPAAKLSRQKTASLRRSALDQTATAKTMGGDTGASRSAEAGAGGPSTSSSAAPPRTTVVCLSSVGKLYTLDEVTYLRYFKGATLAKLLEVSNHKRQMREATMAAAKQSLLASAQDRRPGEGPSGPSRHLNLTAGRVGRISHASIQKHTATQANVLNRIFAERQEATDSGTPTPRGQGQGQGQGGTPQQGQGQQAKAKAKPAAVAVAEDATEEEALKAAANFALAELQEKPRFMLTKDEMMRIKKRKKLDRLMRERREKDERKKREEIHRSMSVAQREMAEDGVGKGRKSDDDEEEEGDREDLSKTQLQKALGLLANFNKTHGRKDLSSRKGGDKDEGGHAGLAQKVKGLDVLLVMASNCADSEKPSLTEAAVGVGGVPQTVQAKQAAATVLKSQELEKHVKLAAKQTQASGQFLHGYWGAQPPIAVASKEGEGGGGGARETLKATAAAAGAQAALAALARTTPSTGTMRPMPLLPAPRAADEPL